MHMMYRNGTVITLLHNRCIGSDLKCKTLQIQNVEQKTFTWTQKQKIIDVALFLGNVGLLLLFTVQLKQNA